MNALFVPISLDQLDTDYREWVAQFCDLGFRMTVVRYLPTGAIDIILHEKRRPSASVMRGLATRHLLDSQVGTMQ